MACIWTTECTWTCCRTEWSIRTS